MRDISDIIKILFGFVAGVSFKNLINSFRRDERASLNEKPPHINPCRDVDELQRVQKTELQFCLNSISYLFDKYGVELSHITSFSRLLRKIENETYRNSLLFFINNAHSSTELVHLIENGQTEDIRVEPKVTYQGIMISESILNQMLAKENIDASVLPNLLDKIQTLVTLYNSKGLARFQKTLGPSMNRLLSEYEAGKNVDYLYDEIMDNLRKTLDFITV